MCVAPLAAAGASGLGGLSSLFQVLGGLFTAVTTIQQANTAAAVAAQNAEAQDEAARDALEQGRQESDRRRRAAAALLGQQKVAMAANGVDLSSDTALDLLDDTKFLSEEDAFAIRENNLRNAKGFAQQAANYRAEAASARSAGLFGGISTLLTTGVKVGKRWAPYVAHGSAYG